VHQSTRTQETAMTAIAVRPTTGTRRLLDRASAHHLVI
jgi:hypothetical protein